VLKRFLCTEVMGRQLAAQETAVKRFYRKKLKTIGPGKAQVAAVRKLSAVVWWNLTHRQPYREQDEELTCRKGSRLERVAVVPVTEVSAEELASVGERLEARVASLERPGRESGHPLS